MKIFFARHGDYHNPDKVVPYRLSGFPLSELGIEQAKLQAEQLSTEKIRTLSTSPIERCVQAATIIGQKIVLHPNQYKELIETGTPLQGLTSSELKNLSPNYPYDVTSHIEGGGESPEAIFERMNNFVNKLKLMSKNSSHLIVSHGDPITIFLIKTLSGTIPHTIEEFEKNNGRYIPMGGLVMLDYSQPGIPKYAELI